MVGIFPSWVLPRLTIIHGGCDCWCLWHPYRLLIWQEISDFSKATPKRSHSLHTMEAYFLLSSLRSAGFVLLYVFFPKVQEALTPSTWSLWLPCCSPSIYKELRGEHVGRYYTQSTFITLARTWSHGVSVSYCCCNKLEKLKEYTFILFKVWKSEVWNQFPSLKLRC